MILFCERDRKSIQINLSKINLLALSNSPDWPPGLTCCRVCVSKCVFVVCGLCFLRDTVVLI